MSSGVTGKLSSRIMNMKFMRFSKLKGDGGDGDNTATEGEVKPVLNEASNADPKGFHDNSEWFALEAGKDEGNRKKRVVKLGRLTRGTTAVVQNLGFTTLKMNERSALNTNNIGRRFHGGTVSKVDESQEILKKDKSVTKEDKNKSNDDDSDDDDYELDKIFKENMRKRRLEGGNSNNSKSRGTKKNKNTNKKRKKNNGRR